MFDRLDWYTRQAPWRNEPATESQYQMLESLGSKDRPATKGEASDAISQLVPPSDDEQRFLRRHGIDASRMSQFEAMDAIARFITDEKNRQEWQGIPLLRRDVRRGDRVMLLNADNSTWIGEILAASSNPLKVKPINADGMLGAAIEVHTSQLLAREGQKPVKHAGNLIPGDLIYTPDHRSGLQYGKVVRGSRHNTVTCLRWIEAKSEWTKNAIPLHEWSGIEFIGHESDAAALNSFFTRIEKDRAMWQASSGRSGMVRVPGEPGVYAWQQKQRQWAGNDLVPVNRSSLFTPGLPQFEQQVREPPSIMARLMRWFTRR